MAGSIRLLALDMDGTLLDSRKRITPATVQAISDLSARGIPVALSTGRGLAELEGYEEELSCIAYGNLASGAVIYDFGQTKALQVTPISQEAIDRILEQRKREDMLVHVQGIRESAMTQKDMDRLEAFGMGTYRGLFERILKRPENLKTYLCAHSDEIVKIDLYHLDPTARTRTRQQLQALPLELKDAETASLECSPVHVSKASGLAALCRYLHISTEEVACVGDADNDLEAMRLVGMPVAMGNANNAVRAAARLVVQDNDHDGVAEAISRLF